MELGNSILETEDVNKSNQSTSPKKKRLAKVSTSKVHIPTMPLEGEEVVVIAKKKTVPGMIPRQDRRATGHQTRRL
jgi:hypothetical protein